MKPETLFRAIGQVPDTQILEADRPPAVPRRRPFLRLIPAACLTLLVVSLALWSGLDRQANQQPPEDGIPPVTEPEDSVPSVTAPEDSAVQMENRPSYSRGVEIAPLDPDTPHDYGTKRDSEEDQVSSGASMQLAWRTPEELFAQNTLIFRGVVEEMQYFTVGEIGSLGGCFTLAEVRVTQVLRGSLTEGSTCKVLLPVVRGFMSSSIVGALEEIQVGSEAIFMPRPATPETCVQEDGRCFCYADAADAYFSEGLRFIFLQTEDGLRFERNVYTDIQDAQTLDEVAAYLRGMLD